MSSAVKSKRDKARLSVSTWSLHRTLGSPNGYGPDGSGAGSNGTNGVALIDLPPLLAEFGIHTLEICHFHMASKDAEYVAQLRHALEENGIELWSLLIDGGDIAHPIHAERDLAWTEAWIDVAAELGAVNARVAAGRQDPSSDVVERSRAGMARLAAYANTRGVRLTTENWLETFSTPEIVLDTLEELDGQVGLCVDFGNWTGSSKYDDLELIMSLGESCHTKAHFSGPTEMDQDDYVRCLELSRKAGFAGPYTLIYDGPNDDEWAGLAQERAVVNAYL